MSVSAVSFAGDIQVFCEPGLRVYLDGELMGISSTQEDGLFLSNAPEGMRRIRVEKDGFVPQSIEVEVSDYPIEVRVGKLSPGPFASYTKEPDAGTVPQLHGNLTITSAPQNCTVEIDGKSETKDTPQLSIGRIAAGEHTISFSKPGYEPISRVVTIHPKADVTVRGDLFAGKVETTYEGRGALRVISNPSRCTVRFRGKTEEKIHMSLNLTQIPAGEYPIFVSIRGRKLSTNVLIMNEQRTILEVSFVKGDEPFVVSYVPR
jgi:hypothetical protein